MRYYTYVHTRINGDVFYVGKGIGERAFSRSDRSIAWKEVVAGDRGYTAFIAAEWDTEEEAFSHEQALIAIYKSMGAKLVNQTSGGKGPKDYVQSEETRRKRAEISRGRKYGRETCPHCGEHGAGPAMKRHHFDNCIGKRPMHKARVTINGVRTYLGKFQTKEEADMVMLNKYIELGIEPPEEFFARSDREYLKSLTVPSGARLVIL